LGCGGAPEALTDEQVARLKGVYSDLQASYPKSNACRRSALDFLRGDAFTEALAQYIVPFLRKGVPALGTDLAPLYYTSTGGVARTLLAWRVAACGTVITDVEHNLRTRSAFPGAPDGSEGPGVHPWAVALLAQHHASAGDPATGLTVLQTAVDHTPTNIDLYVMRSRMLAQNGDLSTAADVADEARSMDLADRYLNSLAVQACLAADRLTQAEDLAALFARQGAGGPAKDGAANLTDMQCMWYTLGVADSHLRCGRLGLALKRYGVVRKHFEDFYEDQLDFHNYCVRKVTLRAYVRLLRLLDHGQGDGYFRRAAAGAIAAYLTLHDRKVQRTAASGASAGQDGAASGDGDASGPGGTTSPEEDAALPANERKKARAKARKAEQQALQAQQAQQQAAAAAAASNGKTPAAGSGAAATAPVDADPNGEKLAATADPLQDASAWVVSLTQHAGEHPETHALAAEVYCRKGRLLLALRAALQLQRLTAAKSEHASAGQLTGEGALLVRRQRVAQHVALVRVLRDCTAALRAGGPPPVVATLLQDGVRQLLDGAADAVAYNAAYLAASGDKEGHDAAAALLKA
jgi:peptide alpha-N-acetyltransferase